MFFVQSPVLQLLEKSLDAASLRQKVIADNIANINTPNFKKSEVNFEEQLQLAVQGRILPLRLTHPRHISTVSGMDNLEPRVVQDKDTTMRADGNNVDIDEEMVALAKNSVKYNASVQELNDRLGLLRLVITGGRR